MSYICRIHNEIHQLETNIVDNLYNKSVALSKPLQMNIECLVS